MNKPAILFVDDEPNLLSGLRRLTRAHASKWDMTFVASGAEALEVIDQRPINLVITDMRMPGMDGARLLELISERAPGTFRFALSGETDMAQAIRIAGRSHRFLAKPIEPDALFKTIDSLFEISGAFPDRSFIRSMAAFNTLQCAHGRLDALKKLVMDQDDNEAQIIALIMADPSLSVRMLQLANSAYFGSTQRTINISRAISHVGLNRLAQLLDHDCFGRDYAKSANRCNDHIVRATAALAAREKAAADGKSDSQQDLAYATALFSRIGAYTDGGLTENLARPPGVAALFGLPDRLVKSLTLFIEMQTGDGAQETIADLALKASTQALATAKEAA